jgi:branched-chain amino acid transport system substrate-binding protein
MRKLDRFATGIIASLLSLSLIPSAHHVLARTSSSPGVTDTSIMVGTSLPLSGPAGAYGVIAGGIQAYFNYVNAHGGVNGRKLSLTVLDDGYDPLRTQINVKRLVLSTGVFGLLGVLGTANNLAALKFVTQQQVPLIYPATGSTLMAKPFKKYLFPLQVTYTVEGKVLTDYASKTLHAKKLGVFYQNDDFGKEGLDAVTARAKLDGVTVADAESYEITDTDLSAQVQKLQQAGVDAVIIFAVPSPAATFIGTSAKIGLRVPMLSSSIASDPGVIKALGPAGEGIYFDAYSPLPTSQDPRAVFYRMVMTKYGNLSQAPIGTFTEAGVGAAEVFVEGLKRAGKNLTRADFIAALETFKKFNGTLFPNLTFTATDHSGVQGAYMLRSHNGGLVAISGYEYP